MSDTIMLRCESVCKEYRLGSIGGTTLQEDLHRIAAKLRRKEDPTLMIGEKKVDKSRFSALDNVSFEVKKGEAVGIIGHNGAGKSTLLKLITRVTGPSAGTIYLNGRVASMLEVGTGFHPELTGRENIYMNGAILGMTKAEIDRKLEEIIEFSEVRQFIDTPVKRYSSGMYVKLAFSVAAHLDSEIVIMDEVLAVGDMAFQNKCLSKMREAATKEGRTVLYVSHNMSTIRQLCDRVIVLEKGRVIYDGEVEEGIGVYLSNAEAEKTNRILLSEKERPSSVNGTVKMELLSLPQNDDCVYKSGEKIRLDLTLTANKNISGAKIGVTAAYKGDAFVGTALTSEKLTIKAEEKKEISFEFDTSCLSEGAYSLSLSILQCDDAGNAIVCDRVDRACTIEIKKNESKEKMNWEHRSFGSASLPELKML